MIDFEYKERYDFNDLVKVMEILRQECPWEGAQTHASMRQYLLEEAYELAEAIDLDDKKLLREELGDLLMHVVSHTNIEREAGCFDIDDVADGVCRKMIERSPHVFGSGEAATPEEVDAKWQDIKRREKGQNSHSDAIDAVAKSLPALIRARKVLSKAERGGFGFADEDEAWAKFREEITELHASTGKKSAEEELGDVLLALVSIAEKKGIDPEEALERATARFARRFRYVEEEALKNGEQTEEMPAYELDRLWSAAKQSGL